MPACPLRHMTPPHDTDRPLPRYVSPKLGAHLAQFARTWNASGRPGTATATGWAQRVGTNYNQIVTIDCRYGCGCAPYSGSCCM
jgi:hypothetical protein